MSSGRTILVTGGAGFIGSHLCERLVGDGHRVRILDDLSTGRVENLTSLRDEPRVSLVVGSVTDARLVGRAMRSVEYVVHLAAAVGVRRIMDDPLGSLEVNARGAWTVLEAASRRGIRTLFASTSEVYGKVARTPSTESDDCLLGSPDRLRWSYAAAKLVSESLVAALGSGPTAGTVVRLFNTVGPRQTGTYGMVIPRFVEAALGGRPLEVHGDGSQSRCFCHVADAVDALARLLVHPRAAGRTFNVGSDVEISINELAHRVMMATGSSSPVVHVPYDLAYGPGFEDPRRRIPDTTAIATLIGWRARRSLTRVIRDVVDERRSESGNPPMVMSA